MPVPVSWKRMRQWSSCGVERDGEGTAVGHGADGVAAEIPENLLQLVAIAFGNGLGMREVALDSDAGLAVFQQGQRVGEKLAEIDPGALKLAVARVGEEVSDDGVEALGFAGDDADQGTLIVGESGNGGQHLDRAGDGGERIANLMGDAGGEASDGGQAVALTEFALEVANHGEVGKGVDVADGGAIGSIQQGCSRCPGVFPRRRG